jgi:hypothetical protein
MMVPQVMIPVTGKVETAEFAVAQHGPYFPDQVLAIAQRPISQRGLVLGAGPACSGRIVARGSRGKVDPDA